MELRRLIFCGAEVSFIRLRASRRPSQSLRPGKPVLVLLDLKMALVDGFEFLRERNARLGKAFGAASQRQLEDNSGGGVDLLR